MAKRLGINIKMGADLKNFSKDMQNVARQMKKTGRKMKNMGRTMSRALTLPLGIAGVAMIKFASDVEESLNKVDVAFGDSSKEVKDFAKTTLKAFGIANGTALEMASNFGDMATSMGVNQSEAAKMSTTLVGLAGDMASFKNVSISRAQTALDAVFTGETETLKKLGIVMTQVELNAFAMSKGMTKTVQQMAGAEKVQLRYQFLMDRTSNSHGDFIRTGGGAANQMRIFQEGMKELAEQFGKIVLPMFTKVVNKLNGLVQWFGTLSDSTKKTMLILGGIVAALGPAIFIFGQLAISISAIIPLFVKLKIAAAGSLGPIGLAITAVALLVTGFIALNKHLKENSPLTKKTNTVVKDLKDSYGKLQTQIEKLQGVNESGVKISKQVRDELRAETKLTIKNTIAKMENAREARRQMKAELELQQARAMEATRGVGVHGDVGFSKATKKAERLQEEIKKINDELKNSVGQIFDLKTQLLGLDAPEVLAPTTTTSTGTGGITEVVEEIEKVQDRTSDSIDSLIGDMGRFGDATDTKLAKPMVIAADIVNGAFDDLTKKSQEALEGTGGYMQTFFESMKQIGEQVNQMFNDLLAGSTFEFFDRLGAGIVESKDAFKGFGESILRNVGEFLGQFGKMLMAAAVATDAFKKLAKAHPALAFAAGAALVVISGAINQHLKGSSTAMDTGGGTNDFRSPIVNNAGFGSGGGSQITLDTVIYGQDILLSSNRANNTVSRTRRK